MPSNFYLHFLIALVPMVIGAAYYHPKVVGSAWMRVNGFTEASLQEANMALIFGLAYLFSLMLSFFYTSLVIHQASITSLFVPEIIEAEDNPIKTEIMALLANYGDRHRNFGHGAVHGIFTAIFFALPIIAINALFDRRSRTYILIHFGYWLLTLILMGGLLCATLRFSWEA